VTQVEVRDLRVDYGRLRAIEALSVTVEAGRCLVVRGSNGAGKSTLLRVLAGVIRPTSGTATVGGRVADRRDRRFRALVAALLSSPPTAPDLTLEEHLALVGVSWGVDGPAALRRGRDLLGAFDAEHLARRFPHELSSGQAQAFALCLTFARPADVLLLDEPEQRLDDGRIALLVEQLRQRVDGGTTLVVATHHAQLVDALSAPTLSLVPVGATRA
jgi:ABC-type multidrug transport system ATPase subunit